MIRGLKVRKVLQAQMVRPAHPVPLVLRGRRAIRARLARKGLRVRKVIRGLKVHKVSRELMERLVLPVQTVHRGRKVLRVHRARKARRGRVRTSPLHRLLRARF